MIHRLWHWLTWLVVIGCLASFAVRVVEEWSEVTAAAGALFVRWTTWLALLLTPVVLTLEAMRWRVLRGGMQPQGGRSLRQDFLTAFRVVALGGSSPGGLAEHVARALEADYQGDEPTQATGRRRLVALSVVCSVLMTTAVALLGVVGALRLMCLEEGQLVVRRAHLWWILILFALLCVVVLVVYAVWPRARRWVGRVRALVGWRRLCGAWGLSVAKVLAFSLQLALLAHETGGCATGLFPAVLVYYFLLTLVPRVALADVGVKGALALAVIVPFAPQAYVVAAIILLWLFNAALPALIGFLSFLRIRRAKS